MPCQPLREKPRNVLEHLVMSARGLEKDGGTRAAPALRDYADPPDTDESRFSSAPCLPPPPIRAQTHRFVGVRSAPDRHNYLIKALIGCRIALPRKVSILEGGARLPFSGCPHNLSLDLNSADLLTFASCREVLFNNCNLHSKLQLLRASAWKPIFTKHPRKLHFQSTPLLLLVTAIARGVITTLTITSFTSLLTTHYNFISYCKYFRLYTAGHYDLNMQKSIVFEIKKQK
jgi:hypothetical protein